MKVKRTRQEQGDYFVVGPDSDESKMCQTRSMAVSYAIQLAGRASRMGREETYYVWNQWDESPLVAIESHPYPNDILVGVRSLDVAA